MVGKISNQQIVRHTLKGVGPLARILNSTYNLEGSVDDKVAFEVAVTSYSTMEFWTDSVKEIALAIELDSPSQFGI